MALLTVDAGKYMYQEQDIVVMLDSDEGSHDSENWPTKTNIVSSFPCQLAQILKRNQIKAMNNLVQGRRTGDRIVFACELESSCMMISLNNLLCMSSCRTWGSGSGWCGQVRNRWQGREYGLLASLCGGPN